MTDEPARCGYSKCRAELAAPGPQGGRRRTFCRESRWEGGRTCAQLARAERDALDALGLDSSRAAFGLDADRLREHVDAVRGPVTALTQALSLVTARIDEVEAHAVAAVEEANRQAAAAEATRLAAERDRDEAVARARRSGGAADRAAVERADAVARAAAAARQALEATEALGAARQRADEAVAARAKAEAGVERLGEQLVVAERHRRDVQLAAERVAAERDAQLARSGSLAADLAEATKQNILAAAAQAQATERVAAAVTDRDAERAARHALGADLAGARARAEAEAERHRAEIAGLQDDLRAAVARRETADSEGARLRAELEAARPAGAELRELITAAIADRG